MGNIVAFKYVKNKNLNTSSNKHTKEKPYTWEYASTNFNKGDGGRSIEILSTWYICSNDGVFRQFNNNHFFVDMNNYVATVNMNAIGIINNDCQNLLAVPSEHLVELKNSLYELFVK